MEYSSGGSLISRRHYGANAGQVLTAQQLDIADLDADGSTVDYVSISPLYDGAFDCVGCLDHTGTLAESYVHAFDGVATITNGAGQAIATSAIGWQQGYGRGYRDPQTGFVYNLNRYYDPSLGRFLTEDPMGRWFDHGARGNGYAWVGNGFRNAWDPLGLKQKRGPKVRPFISDIREAAAAANAEGDGDANQWDADGDGEGACTYCVLRELEVAAGSVSEIGRKWLFGKVPFGAFIQDDPERPGKYRIVFNESVWSRIGNHERLFTVLHELLHATMKQCRQGPHNRHHRNDPNSYSYRMYQWNVLRIFKILKKHGKGQFAQVTDQQMQELESKYGTKPRKPEK